MTVDIRIGDCLDHLRAMPADSVHCVVTSPPYWGLRDYGIAGQIGSERTLAEHLAVMVDVFREVRRVLRPDGTCWVNYGDCYATKPAGWSAQRYKDEAKDDRTFRDKPFSTIGPIYDPEGGQKGGGHRGENKGGGAPPSGRVVSGGFLKPKDLCMLSNRLAIALQDDGWWVRSEIIWAKPNPMPESTRDRPTSAHEKLWLLAKSERYFYDADAVRTACVSATTKMPDGWATYDGGHGSHHRDGREKGASQPSTRKRDLTPRHEGHINHQTLDDFPRGTANLRNVWTIPSAPFSDAHFATFPPALVEPCIKAGTSERGCCSACGAPLVRQTTSELVPTAKAAKTCVVDQRDIDADASDQGANRQKDGHTPGMARAVTTTGFSPMCDCSRATTVPCTVLDPFGGAGTVGLVAERLGRDSILIELNPDYAQMARNRILLERQAKVIGLPPPKMAGLPLLDAIEQAKESA